MALIPLYDQQAQELGEQGSHTSTKTPAEAHATNTEQPSPLNAGTRPKIRGANPIKERPLDDTNPFDLIMVWCRYSAQRGHRFEDCLRREALAGPSGLENMERQPQHSVDEGSATEERGAERRSVEERSVEQRSAEERSATHDVPSLLPITASMLIRETLRVDLDSAPSPGNVPWTPAKHLRTEAEVLRNKLRHTKTTRRLDICKERDCHLGRTVPCDPVVRRTDIV